MPGEWQAAFKPVSRKAFAKWPNITDLFPWQQSGAQFKRSWPIAPEKEVLVTRWKELTTTSDKAALFVETRDRKINKTYSDLRRDDVVLTAIDKATKDDIVPPVRYAFRSFDRQWILPDSRLGDYLRPIFWQTYSEKQIFIAGMFYVPLGNGPAVTVCANIPDLHYFCNRGAKDIIPLYRDAACERSNILPGLLDILEKAYGRKVSPKDFAGYVYGVLAQPEYTRRFADELASKEVRVPLTKDKKLFTEVSEFGKELIWLHTYGERLYDAGHPEGQIPKGKAQCTKAISDQESGYPNEFHYDEDTKEIHVGDGVFAPVPPEIWEFEVSGLKVVQSWLGYRMKDRSGKKSSPLDDIRPRTWTREFTRELLELLWILERTTAGYAKQKQLLEAVLDGELFTAAELPAVPDEARQAPKVPRGHADQQRLDLDEE